MPKINLTTSKLSAGGQEPGQFSRRKFLGFAGATTGLIVIGSSCNKEDVPSNTNLEGVDLGSGDVGILNYAYALEQLEAAFYTMVMMSPYSGMSGNEQARITDIRDHEIAHREFFKNALGDAKIMDLEFDFSSVNFGSRESVLATSKTFEDLGVAAYNGAGRLIVSGDYLTLAGKIVSVEARHAAYIRELISPGSFSSGPEVDDMGLDSALKPTDVLEKAKAFIKTEINASNLPTY